MASAIATSSPSSTSRMQSSKYSLTSVVEPQDPPSERSSSSSASDDASSSSPVLSSSATPPPSSPVFLAGLSAASPAAGAAAMASAATTSATSASSSAASWRENAGKAVGRLVRITPAVSFLWSGTAAMASNGSSTVVGEMQSSLERVRRQLSSTSTRQLLQGPLLKRSDTLKKWNERWVILDPTTGKIEYKVRRSDKDVRGVIAFDSTSTVTLSPTNFHGLSKYDGCCFYIGTPQKKEYFLCAETPSAARAWVSTLHATQLVLQAHKEAVNSLGENSPAKLGTVATVVAVANATAIEATKEVEAAMKISLRAALGSTTNKLTKGQLDDLTIMMETLRVKDDELHQILQDMRARDSTINEIADKLQETAEAAETAASAARSIDEERRFLSSELERLKQDHEKQVEVSLLRLKESEEKAKLLVEERDHLLTERDSALQEAQMWRSELGKARGNAVILEAAVVRAEEKARVSAADADMRVKEAMSRLESAIREKEDLLALVDALQLQIKRQETSTIQVCEESSELCSTTSKHMEDDNVDKACVSDTGAIPVAENIVELDEEGVDIRTIGDTEWGNPHSSEVSDVREVTTEPEENSLDIPVDT